MEAVEGIFTELWTIQNCGGWSLRSGFR